MAAEKDRRVVLTGCGWVTPFAAGTIDDVLAAAPGEPPSAGTSYRAVPGTLLDQYADLSAEVKADKGAWLAAVAIHHARRQAGLERGTIAPDRLGLVLGCGLAGQAGMIDFANEVRAQSARFVSPLHFPRTVGNYIAGVLARAFGIKGPNLTLASGPASGLDAIVTAADLVATGQADAVLAGGVEALSNELAQLFTAPPATPSEGACFFVVESADRAADRTADRAAQRTADQTAQRRATPLATLPGESLGARDGLPPIPLGCGTGFQPVPTQVENLCHNTCRDRLLSTLDATRAILSSAAGSHPGAICIEHWIGHCPGAAGTAAIAAAIAAAQGTPVPVTDLSDCARVAVQPIALDASIIENGNVPAVVFADTPDGHRRTLALMACRRR